MSENNQNIYRVPGAPNPATVQQQQTQAPVHAQPQQTPTQVPQQSLVQQQAAPVPPQQPKVVPKEIDTSTADQEPTDPNAVKQDNTPVDSDFDDFVREHVEEYRARREYKNLEKVPLAVSCSDYEKLSDLQDKVYREHQKDIDEVLSDMTSDVHTINNAQQSLSAATECLQDSLKLIKGDLNEKLKRSVDGVGDTKATVFNKYKGEKTVTLDGAAGFMAMTALTGGIRRVYLWNSGIVLTLRNLPLDVLARYYREVNHTDYEYGKNFGVFYYLFSDLTIKEYILEHLLPVAVCGSNYARWKDIDALRSVISAQDFNTILWALAVMMYPNGAPVKFVCAEPGQC